MKRRVFVASSLAALAGCAKVTNGLNEWKPAHSEPLVQIGATPASETSVSLQQVSGD